MSTDGLCSATDFLMMPAALAACLMAFFAVGLVMASSLWHAGWRVPPAMLPLLVVGCASALGYGFFWVYLVSPSVGKLATLVLAVVVSAHFIEAPGRVKVLELLRLPDLWIPFALALSVGLFLTAITYVGVESLAVCPADDTNFVNRRLLSSGSPDYMIQKLWADGLSNGFPPWNWVLDPAVSRSTVADRPPLLAGIVLLFNSIVPGKYVLVYFMAMTSVASLAWIPAIWGLARSAGLTLARASSLIVMLSFVYFFWFSTIFSWPKMLSGSLYVGAFLLLFLERESEVEPVSLSLRSMILGASFAGLSYVTHFSVAMLLLVTASLLLMPKRWPGIRLTLVGAGIFLVITMPYSILKSTHEGSSSLTKYMLAGNFIQTVPDAELNAMPTLEVVRRAYSALTWHEIIQNRFNSFAGIFKVPCLLQCNGITFKQSRDIEVWPIMASLKLFNLGWLILVPLLFMGNVRLGLSAPWDRIRIVAQDGLLIVISGLIVFLIVAFSNVDNSATSGFVLLLISVAGIALFSLPSKLVGLFSLLVVGNFLWFTSQIFLEDNLTLAYPLLALAFLSIAGMAALIKVSASLPASPPITGLGTLR